jgi:uncharacterized RDD family membrane protein YckC
VNVTEVVTGEAVVLEVPCARFPSRLVALAIDLAIQWILLIILATAVGLTSAGGGLDVAAGAAVTVAILVLVTVGYPVIWETVTRGRSPGKFALGLRVVSDDGSAERFRQALVRGLAAAVEIWALLGCPALICSLLSEKGKRLGDVFAGTFVIQQRLPARRQMIVTPAWMPPELAGWAAGLELSGLTDQTAAMARGYLGRLAELNPSAQAELGQRIAAAVSAQVSPAPPPGTPVPAYLGAVLAERNRREHARLMRPQAPAGSASGPPASQPAMAPPSPPGAAPPPPGAAPPAPWVQPAPAPSPPPEPGTAWKGATWEQEKSGAGRPDQPGQPADSPAPASGGFVPPQ